MGLTWAVAWSGAGIVVAAALRFQADAPFPIVFGVLGFFSGVMFSTVFALTEGRSRRFDQMSVPRFAGWGAVGGALLAALFSSVVGLGWGDMLVVVPTFAVASAVCASGTLALAKRAASPQLPDEPERPKLP